MRPEWNSWLGSCVLLLCVEVLGLGVGVGLGSIAAGGYWSRLWGYLLLLMIDCVSMCVRVYEHACLYMIVCRLEVKVGHLHLPLYLTFLSQGLSMNLERTPSALGNKYVPVYLAFFMWLLGI